LWSDVAIVMKKDSKRVDVNLRLPPPRLPCQAINLIDANF